jgi:DNA-binding CsgD family transcriptional regulator
MPSTLEVWRPEGCQRFSLDGEPCTIGSAASSDVVLASDDTVSRLHAILEQVGDSWCLRDLASRNGTTVNGERLITQRPLHDRDEIRLGRTRLVFRADPAVDHGARTAAAQAAPSLTRRERDVLDALCRPVLRGDVFTEPSSIREIAAALVVTEAAVKQHLARLYDKFIIPEEGERRRVRLANAAIRRGAVALPNLLDD